MGEAGERPGRRLTGEQRAQVVAWVSGGADYAEVRRRLEQRGWLVIRRQAVSYYRVRLRRGLAGAATCPTCGQAVPVRCI